VPGFASNIIIDGNSGSGTLTLDTDPIFFDFINTSSALVFLAGSHTMEVNGNWNVSNSGTFTAGTGTIILEGSLSQTLTSGGNAFYNLTQISAGTYTLQDALAVSNSLTITTGTFVANNNA